MCGRMALSLPQDAMAQLFNARPANDLPPVPDFNICPTDSVHIVTRADDGPRSLSAMRWGLVPQWYKKPDDGPLLINARAETVADKPAFRDAVRLRRGLVIASGFYEWTKDADGGRDPWYFTRTDGHPLAFAAIWQEWADVDLRHCHHSGQRVHDRYTPPRPCGDRPVRLGALAWGKRQRGRPPDAGSGRWRSGLAPRWAGREFKPGVWPCVDCPARGRACRISDVLGRHANWR